MPRKRKQNVAREIRASGNRSEAFAQGQRRVSTPRGRGSNLTLMPQVRSQQPDRLTQYAQQSLQQVAGAQRREGMDKYYESRARETQKQEEAQQEKERQVRETALAEQQAREQVRQGARAQVRGIRDRQEVEKATKSQALSDRLGRAQARVLANKERRQGLSLANQQQNLQAQHQQANLHQQRQQHNESLAQQRQIASTRLQVKEQQNLQQLALQREGMSRQDRLIDSHFSQMRGMFREAQQGQERRIGELEGKMNEGIKQLEAQRQQPVDITYLNRASGRELDHSQLYPLDRWEGRMPLQRSDTTTTQSSELADNLLGRQHKPVRVDTTAFNEARRELRKTLSRRDESLARVDTTDFNEAREELKKRGDTPSIAINYQAELRRQERVDRRQRALSLSRRFDPKPEPEPEPKPQPEPEPLTDSSESDENINPWRSNLGKPPSHPFLYPTTRRDYVRMMENPFAPPTMTEREQRNWDLGLKFMENNPTSSDSSESDEPKPQPEPEPDKGLDIEKGDYENWVGHEEGRGAPPVVVGLTLSGMGSESPSDEDEPNDPDKLRTSDSLGLSRLRSRRREYSPEPDPNPDPVAKPQPSTLGENISSGVGQAGQLVGEGISGGLRRGAGVVGGLATGLGEAVYESLPSARDVGRAVGQGAIAGAGAVARAGAGAVADYLEPEPMPDEPEPAPSSQPLLQNVNPIENLGGKFTSGNDRDGWKATQYKVIDVDGVIGKKVKGKEYFVMKKDGRNVSIVDITNPNLTGWNNVAVGRFDKLIKGGKISM